MSKLTLTTIKSFIRKNDGKLFLKSKSDFDSMTDCAMPTKDQGFHLATKAEKPTDPDRFDNNQGVNGAWFVGGSRDFFRPYNQNGFEGYEIGNCCGSFILAIKI